LFVSASTSIVLLTEASKAFRSTIDVLALVNDLGPGREVSQL
jgi:hypothetical protein